MAGQLAGAVLPLPGIADDAFAAAYPGDASEPNMSVRYAMATRLHAYYAAYLGGPETFGSIPRLNVDPDVARIEREWLRWEDEQVDIAQLPASSAEFHDWFLALSASHVQPDFCRYLVEDATIEEVALFFLAEELVDSRFDDLVAMVQLGSAGNMKLVMAENFRDEMGEGELAKMHTRLFDHSARYMRTKLAGRTGELAELNCAEVVENASLTLMYAIHRHLVPRALGAMGLMEHSAPPRFTAMVDACTRLGVPDDVIEYQRVHVHVDEDHGAEWLEHVLVPLAEESPAALQEIGMGVLTRERIANAYYQRVWQHMKALR